MNPSLSTTPTTTLKNITQKITNEVSKNVPLGSTRESFFLILITVPDPHAVFLQTAVLWDHFSSFGEIASIEEEPKQSSSEEFGSGSGSMGGVRITYTHRRSAEMAIAEGKVIQGITIQLAWGAPAKKAPLPVQVTPVKALAIGTTDEAALAGGGLTAGVSPPEVGREGKLKSGQGSGEGLEAVPNGGSPLLEVE